MVGVILFRRYARDAGHLLGKLNSLVRSDCTSRHDHIHQAIHHHVDDLERRIGELAEADRRAAERPLLDGDEVMERLGVGPGPEVGKALNFDGVAAFSTWSWSGRN